MEPTTGRLAPRLWLGWAMLVLVALALIAPSFVGWHHDDDLQNMRWVLEYRDAPWLALTDRHALHDHIRPATLWATWLGAQVSNGAWWGPHLVVAALLLGAWAAMAVLVTRLIGSRVAGFLTAVLILDLEGFRLILDWNSWINTAGELCFGLAGLCLVHTALARSAAGRGARRTLLWAGTAMLISGLFKEPGWVVYPSVAVLMALGARRKGDRSAAPFWVGSLLLLGVAGFLWSHTTANVQRLGSDIDVLAKLGDLKHAVRPFVDPWPGGEPRIRVWVGIALPLVSLALAAAVVLRKNEHPTETQSRAIILGTVALTGLGYIRPDLVGAVVGGGLIAMLVLHRSGLLAALALLTCGVMVLFPGPNPVQLLPAAMAFAALVAVHTARLVKPGSPQVIRLFAGLLLAGGLGLEAMQLAERIHAPDASPRDVPGQIESRDQVFGEGALFSALGTHMVFYSSELGARLLGPILGFHVIPYDRDLEPFSMQVSGTLWAAMDSGAAESALLELNLLDAHRAGGHPGTLELDLEPGFYAAGMVLVNTQGVASISIKTSCADDLFVENDRAGTSWVVATLRVREGCGSVEVDVRTLAEGTVETVFLTALPDPSIDLRSADFHGPVLGLPPVNPMPEKH